MFELGNVKIASIYFGTIKLDGGSMFGVVPKTIWSKLLPADENNLVDFSMQGLVIFDGNQKIIVDAGAGTKYSEKQKAIFGFTYPENGIAGALEKLDLKTEDITDAIITHLHFDHAGGFTYRDEADALKPTFPNAKHHIQKAHLELTRNINPREKASILKENYEPLIEAGLINAVEDDEQISPHTKVKRSDGHTRGMQTVWITGDEKSAVFLADLIPTSAHLPINYTMGFDIDAVKIMQEREETIEKIIRENIIAVFEHDPNIVAAYIEQGKKHPQVKEAIEL